MILIAQLIHKLQIPAFIPQGLKPALILRDFFGMAEAMPFQKRFHTISFWTGS
jgi:hypothetical protein